MRTKKPSKPSSKRGKSPMQRPLPEMPSEVAIVYRKLGREKANGQWIEALSKIEIDPRLEGEKHLEVLVHETLHCLLPFLEETSVGQLAVNMAGILYADGYRKEHSIEL